MKILLVGNYSNNKQQSMQRFSEMLAQGLTNAGHSVRVVGPPAVLGKLKPTAEGVGKWLGYVDQFGLFPIQLRKAIAWADVVHICDQANAVHVSHLKDKPYVVTCHDMLAIRSALGEIEAHSTRWTGQVLQQWILSGLKKTQYAVCVSEATKGDLLRIAGLDSDRVAVVPNALNYPYRPMKRADARDRLVRIGIANDKRYLLHVGGNQWYKNREGVLRIFHEFVKMDGCQHYLLIMAGKPWTSRMHDYVRNAGLEGKVLELTEVSNEDLRALYSSAEALIFPSLCEGFGWPIIEAQACGCPVFTTNRPPMNEVGGQGAVYFDPSEIPSAARTIALELRNTEKIRKAGLENVNRFTMERMIDGYLKAYEYVLTYASGRPITETIVIQQKKLNNG